MVNIHEHFKTEISFNKYQHSSSIQKELNLPPPFHSYPYYWTKFPPLPCYLRKIQTFGHGFPSLELSLGFPLFSLLLPLFLQFQKFHVLWTFPLTYLLINQKPNFYLSNIPLRFNLLLTYIIYFNSPQFALSTPNSLFHFILLFHLNNNTKTLFNQLNNSK
jgi:hypothetical protein